MGYSIMGFRWIHGSFKTAAKRRHIIRLQYLTSSEMKTRHAQRRSQEVGTCKDMLSVATPESLVCCFKGKV